MAEANIPSVGQAPLVCEICESTDIEDEVTWYCNDCKASLCCKCKKEHLEGKPVKIFKRHKIIPRVEAVKSRLSKDEGCSIHSGSYYNLHCNTCHQLVCNHCIIEEHNGHDFCKIEDAMEKVRQDMIQYSDTIENTFLAECIYKESTITENHNKCENFYSIKERDVQKKREKLKGDVDRLCDDVLQTIATEKMKNMSIIDQDKIAVQAKIQEIRVLLDTKTEAMKKSNSDMIKFTKEKAAIADFKSPTISQLHLSSLIDEHLGGLHVAQSYPSLDNSILSNPGDNEVSKNTLSTTGVTHVEQSMTTDGMKVKAANQVKQPITTDDNQVKQPMTPDINQVNQSKTTDDNNQISQAEASVTDVQILGRHKYYTPIKSIACVDEDRVWLYDMKILKLINRNGETLKKMMIQLPVTHFIVLTSGDVITSHSKDQCLKVRSKILPIATTINTAPDFPSGVCLANDEKHVAVCLYSPDLTSKLAVFGLNGQRKNSFQYTDRKSSHVYLQRVITNQSGDYCVAHRGLDAVFFVSKSGILEFTYDGSTATPMKGTFKPMDITCDKYNNILVSDKGNNTIHMLDQQGKFLRYILTSEQGVVMPRGLCADKEGKLWIGLEDGTLLVIKYLKNL